MTNEQYSNMMIAFAKLEAKIESLETAFSDLLKPSATESKTEIKPEHLSNFWNEDKVSTFNRIGTFHPGATME